MMQNDDGIPTGGHVISWFIKNGKVTFADFQSGEGDQSRFENIFWKYIYPNASVVTARLDDAVPVWDNLKKVVNT